MDLGPGAPDEIRKCSTTTGADRRAERDGAILAQQGWPLRTRPAEHDGTPHAAGVAENRSAMLKLPSAM
jgi:hypothetical protein